MRVNTSRDKVRDIAIEARVTGAVERRFIGPEGPTQCVTPVELHMFGYPDEICVALGTETPRPVAQRVQVRCRVCSACLRHRARLWTARAIDESRASERTWMGTLTLSPDRQTWARYTALAHQERRLGHTDEQTVFRKSVDLIGKETTRYLKRLRKVAPFRYLLVTEAHKNGLPHFHMLLHEYASPIPKTVLESRWGYGFSHWRLVDVANPRACGYVCKYLSKSALTRVRASQDYGQGFVPLLTARLEAATRRVSEAIQEAEGKACQKGEGPPLIDV